MKKIIALLTALVLVFSLCACGTAETPAAAESTAASADAAPAKLMDSPMTFKVATTQSSSGLWVKYMTEAYKEITERTNGDLNFEIYPDSELGSNKDVVEQILAGAPIILGCGFDTMSDYSEKLAVASCPYVFQDMSEVFTIGRHRLVDHHHSGTGRQQQHTDICRRYSRLPSFHQLQADNQP